MKYKVKVHIEKNIEEVFDKIRNPSFYKDWMTGLSEYKLVKETDDTIGNMTELYFKDNKGRQTMMVEKIESIHFPNEYITSYEAGKVFNRCINRFTKTEEDTTVYEMETIFKFGFITELYIWLFRGIFVNQTRAGMVSFKHYIENENEE